MVTSIILQNVSADEIKEQFRLLQIQIQEIKSTLIQTQIEKYLTRTEVADLLQCDLSTIHNWTKKGKLIAYGIGHRVYYKLSDIQKCLKPLKENGL